MVCAPAEKQKTTANIAMLVLIIVSFSVFYDLAALR
jgi:hypothetical protein